MGIDKFVFFGLASLVGCLASVAAFAELTGNDPILSDARWISADADLAYVLTHAPGECLAPANDEGGDYKLVLGRAAFKSPFLFGGQAARNHLSCNSCHQDGHDNKQFFLAGLSGAPGSADVTSSIFSKVREDGIFNPVAIPTLVGSSRKERLGTVSPVATIHDFVEGAVKDEFQGEASASIVEAVSYYVAQLQPEYCPEQAAAINLDKVIGELDQTLDAAAQANQNNAQEEVDFLLLSTQDQLRLIHERYAGAALAAEREAIVAFSQQVGALRPSADRDSRVSDADFADLGNKLRALKAVLEKSEDLSLYQEAVLRDRLEIVASGDL